MDPNVTLAQIRKLIANLDDAFARDLDVGAIAEDLLSNVEALDGWLTKGGFPPDAWNTAFAAR